MKKIKRSTIFTIVASVLAGLLLGGLLFGRKEAGTNEIASEQEKVSQIWTCSMHPQIRQPEPGQCPICGMDLIPLNTEMNGDEDPLEIRMSPTAMQLADVQTSLISMQKPVKEIRLNGKIAADERKVIIQSSHIPGRIEKLFISYSGESVSKGQLLANIYSPELVTAQKELIEAYRIRESQPELYQASRGKLLSWKLTETQIDNIIKEGQVQEQFSVLADVSGVVLEKKVNLGDYINKGQSLFELADLSVVWALFDVYESDISWVKKGDRIRFTIQSLPGESFEGKVTFIDHVIDPRTRVARARVELQNRGGKLKPGMFIKGIMSSPLKAEQEQLIIPKSAVMWTGERSVVYVKRSSGNGLGFTMRVVTLGPSLGDSFIVKDGITEGEEIATHGTFSIDAAAQLAGKPSMMNPEGNRVTIGYEHGGKPGSTEDSASDTKQMVIRKEARESLWPVFKEYLKLKEALVKDDFDESKNAGATLFKAIDNVNMGSFGGESHKLWMKHSKEVKEALRTMKHSYDIGSVRKHFKKVSDHLIVIAVTFGPFGHELFIQHCPMANDKIGAEWISDEKSIKNPYFGESMIGCGYVTTDIK